MRWWSWFWKPQRQLKRERDPDLDYAKRQIENHEYRLQLLENDAEQISGGTLKVYHGPERRALPRH